MSRLERPLAIVGDVHLSHGGGAEAGRALGRWVETHPEAELVLNGDVFNLSLDPAGSNPQHSLLAMLRPATELRRALRAHLMAGVPLSLLPGNHDAALAENATRSALLGWLELSVDAPLLVGLWFLRRGPVHVEHGHVYDPENAPTHPLCVPGPATEPLGVLLTRRFLGPNAAFDFVHGPELGLPAQVRHAVATFGARVPLVLGRYLGCAAQACKLAGWREEHRDEQRAGDARLPAYAAEAGVSLACLQALLEDRPRPTHESFQRTFARLYLDRVLASGALGAALSAQPFLKSRAPAVLALGAVLYLYQSVRRGAGRYERLPVRRLREAAARVRELTAAEHVIFGHTHVAEQERGYTNPGSFTYRSNAARPYAFVTGEGHVERRELSPES